MPWLSNQSMLMTSLDNNDSDLEGDGPWTQCFNYQATAVKKYF